MKISTVQEMRNLDKKATEQYGIPDDILMENAGEAVCAAVLKNVGIKGKKFVIFCGTGNNGGDGFVAARKLHSNGGKVKVFITGEKDKIKGAAARNLEIILRIPLDIEVIKTVQSAKTDIIESDAVIDSLFGTGLTRDVEGKYREIIRVINDCGRVIFSIDIPSGINGNTGKVMGTAVNADYTVTFGLPKIGNVLYPGYENCGKLYVSHISFPPMLYKSINIQINTPLKLPDRIQNGHKKDFGDVLFIAGASGYYGAPYFSAVSFLKAGGGYSRLAAPGSITPFIAGMGSEIVFIPQKETNSGSISIESKNNLLDLSDRVDMVVLGPGLSLDNNTEQLIIELVEEIKKPLLIDGDGLTAISQNIEVLRKRKNETILTPHLGEMSRITKLSVSQIDDNKTEILQKTSEALNAVIVLKGPHSLIGCSDRSVFINTTGNSGMATAGSGDVLTGTIAAMKGLGLSIKDAVRTGVFIHGLAGDIAASDKGEDGITARDILDSLPYALKSYRENYDSIIKENCSIIEIV